MDKTAVLTIMRYMPSKAPALSKERQQLLLRLGAELRQARKRQQVSAVAAAEAACMSRMTLHRIESGEPSVTVGAWLAAAHVLGCRLVLAVPPEGGQGFQ